MASKDVLSEDELDALMDSVSGDEVPTGNEAFDRGCQPFDFTTREQTLLAQMPALKNLNEKHSLALAQGIADLYKISAEIEVEDIELQRLDQALGVISEPSGVNLVKIAPLNGISYVVIPGDLLSFFVDSYFGGKQSGASADTSRDCLTPSERRVNDALVEMFLSILADTWQEKVQLTPQVDSFESNPAFLQASSPDELALRFSFVIKVSDWASKIDWLVPCASLEPLRSKLGSADPIRKLQQKNADWERHFRHELQFVDLEVSGSLISERVSIGELLSFKLGSIVPLKMPTEVTVCVENQPISFGEHGVLNGHKSIKIKEIINDTTDFS